MDLRMVVFDMRSMRGGGKPQGSRKPQIFDVPSLGITKEEMRRAKEKLAKFEGSIIDYQDIIDQDIDASYINLWHLNNYYNSSMIRGKLRPIVGNEEVRMIIPLMWLVAQKSVLIRGESGSAKSEIMKAVVSLVWGDDGLNGTHVELYMIDKTSDKGPLNWEQEQKIKQAIYAFIPELQNAKNQEWIIKKWAEGEPAKYNRTIGGGTGTEEIILEPKPLLSNLADLNEELEDITNEQKRRWISVYTLSSEEVNMMVHMNKARNRFMRLSNLKDMDDDTIHALRKRLKDAMRLRNTVKVVNPYAMAIQDLIPKKYTDSNTYIDYWFDLIEAIALFNADKRLRVFDSKDNIEKLFATIEDNKLAVDIAGAIFINLCLGIPDLGTHILNFFPKLEYDDMSMGDFGDLDFDTSSVDSKKKKKRRKDDRFKTPEEIQDMLDKDGFPRKMEWVVNTLNHLVTGGFLRQTQKGTSYFRTRDLHIEEMIKDWNMVHITGIEAMNSEYPEFVQEWLTTIKGEYINVFGDGTETKTIDISGTLDEISGEVSAPPTSQVENVTDNAPEELNNEALGDSESSTEDGGWDGLLEDEEL